jgi:two-component system phosphate regulon sensor histidine kinase PhoR
MKEEPARIISSPSTPEAGAVGAIPLHTVPLDVGSLLRSALASLQAQASGIDVTIALDVAPGLPLVTADPDKMAWAVTTLVGNALRYVRAGTRLHPGGTIDVAVRRDAGGIAIVIQDDGPGIRDDLLPHLLTRGPGATHAAGLALALVNEVVLAHGGGFEIRSRTRGPDHGTAVKLTLRAD